MNLKELKDLIYQENSVASAKDRREHLTSKMFELNDQGKNCFSCNGMCCTYEFNSMQTTPLEAIELYFFLDKENRLTEDLYEELEENIKKFRLDKDISIGGTKIFRRTYTCPFFKAGAKGCSISLNDKPYGCLGFNPKESNVSTEGHCKVYVNSHEEREKIYKVDEDHINELLISKLGLYWKKLPIPMALIELTKKLGK